MTRKKINYVCFCELLLKDVTILPHNRLVLHKSAKVRNERAVTASEYYVLVFFMQGQETSK